MYKLYIHEHLYALFMPTVSGCGTFVAGCEPYTLTLACQCVPTTLVRSVCDRQVAPSSSLVKLDENEEPLLDR